jgi:large subunit ribosomal protein L13
MTTTLAKKGKIVQRWFVIDATDQVVGRLAVQIATILRGKHRPEYTPHVDTGEFVVVINAEKVKLTGNKLDTKLYNAYSHYPGGLRRVTARAMLATHPERVLEEAVKRMVPRNRMGRKSSRFKGSPCSGRRPWPKRRRRRPITWAPAGARPRWLACASARAPAKFRSMTAS